MSITLQSPYKLEDNQGNEILRLRRCVVAIIIHSVQHLEELIEIESIFQMRVVNGPTVKSLRQPTGTGTQSSFSALYNSKY